MSKENMIFVYNCILNGTKVYVHDMNDSLYDYLDSKCNLGTETYNGRVSQYFYL
jgi:hypothetical protein